MPSCSKPSRYGLERAECCKVGATANLDSSCARRRERSAGRDEETGFQIEQRNRRRKEDAPPSRNSLTKKAPYKGGLHRCAGLRRRQENQGQEAACSRRYIRPAASRCCPSCERPRSRWSHSRHGDPVRDVSLSSKAVRRRWLQGPEFSTALAKVRPHLNVEIVKRSDRAKGFVVLSKRWIVGVSSEGHAVMSVKVRPEPKDSGFEAREAPWRESKTAEPSDNMLERSMREASGCNVQ